MSKTKWHGQVIHLIVALIVVTLAVVLSSGPAPVLAAPAVASVTETAFGDDTTSHNVSLPATVDADDLLIVFFTNDGDADVTAPNGWNQLASNVSGTAVRLSVYYKIAAGTEGGTTVDFVTSASEQAAAQVYRITSWHGTTPPEISTAATGTSAVPNPVSLNPAAWDVADTLWLAVAGQDRGNQAGNTFYPASYVNGTSTLSNSGGNQNCRTLSAGRVLVAASEDPGAFTIPASEQWVAFTVAVRPASRNLTTYSTEGGSVTTPGEGVFSYDEGTVVDLVATPNADYRFVNWTGNVSTIDDIYDASTTIIMNGDYSITANFVRQYDLSTNSTEGGSVTEPGEDTFTHDEGTVIDLLAEADACYEFINWTGDVGTIADVYAASTNITMNGDYNITANFALLTYNLTTDSTAGGSVTTPGESTFTYDCGDVVDLVANPDAGYRFDEWTGDVGTIADVNAAATNITMNGNYSITARFEAVYNLSMAANPRAGGTATDLTNDSPYAEGTAVSIQAAAAAGYRFLNWGAPAGTFGNATAATTTFTMPAQNVTVTANFGLVPPPSVYPTVTTQAATGVTTSSATLNMDYTVGNYTSVDVCFAYKKSTDSAWSSTGWVSKSGNGTHAAPLTGLTSSTQYNFKAQLKYDDTVIEGTTLQFTTSASGGCFIATAAYGTPTAEQIDVLREFRDVVLLKSTVGSQFVALYYRTSPPIADFIARHELVRTLVRELLVDPIVWVVEVIRGMCLN